MKILDELKQEVEQQMHQMGASSIAKRYAKLTPQIKKQLIKKVVHQGQTIRQSSLELSINYSSAKSIVSEFKKQIINDGSHTFQDGAHSLENSQDDSLRIQERRATYSQNMQGYHWNNFALITSIGGKLHYQMTLNQYLPYLMISKFNPEVKNNLKDHEEQPKQQSLDTIVVQKQ